MNNLIIQGSKSTPAIHFDADTKIMEITGESYPENALEFYKPIFDWLAQYFEAGGDKAVFNFKLMYFNTSSSKAILDILDVLDEKFRSGIDIQINWMYQQDDEDIMESGEEFAEGLTVPYKLVSYK